jgi:hypothetical protein
VHIELRLGTLEGEGEGERGSEGGEQGGIRQGRIRGTFHAAVPHYCHWRAAAALCTDPSIIDVSDEEPPN